MLRNSIIVFLTIIVFNYGYGQSDCLKLNGVARVVCLAEAFKSTLTPDQLKLVQLEYSKGDAVRWSNFPQAFARPGRVGLALSTLNEKQMEAFEALMRSVLSGSEPNEGFNEMIGNLKADSFFGAETGKRDVFGSGYYVIVFLGKPSSEKLWELMFGGHHFAFANTYNKGGIIGVTPSFRGVEPAKPIVIDGKTYEPLVDEQRAFADVIHALSDEEKKIATTRAPSGDILLGPGNDDQFPSVHTGIKAGLLNSAVRDKIIEAIALYVNDLNPEIALGFMSKYTSEIDETYLSFAGSGTMTNPGDYIRFDGPSLWLEYSAQPSRDFPGTSHPHSVWRDRKADYGGN